MTYIPVLQFVLESPAIIRGETEAISTNKNSVGFTTAAAARYGNIDNITRSFETVRQQGVTDRPIFGWRYSGVPIIGIKNPAVIPQSQTQYTEPGTRTAAVLVTNTVTVTNVSVFIGEADPSAYIGQYDPATDLAYVRGLSSGRYADGNDALTNTQHTDVPYGLSLLAPKWQRTASSSVATNSAPIVRSEDYDNASPSPIEEGVFKVRNATAAGIYTEGQEAIGRFHFFNANFGANSLTGLSEPFNDSGAVQLAPGSATPPVALVWKPDPNEKAGSRHVDLFCYYTVR